MYIGCPCKNEEKEYVCVYISVCFLNIEVTVQGEEIGDRTKVGRTMFAVHFIVSDPVNVFPVQKIK